MPKIKILSIRIGEAEYRLLVLAARMERRKLSDFVRLALEDKIKLALPDKPVLSDP